MSGPRFILHVDDDASIREVVAIMLRVKGGFEVDSVESGAMALVAAAKRAPDLVLLDVMMPDMDGPETLRRLRTDLGLTRTPVVFLTAKVLQSDLFQLQALGAAAILQKPFRGAELVAQLRRILGEEEG